MGDDDADFDEEKELSEQTLRDLAREQMIKERVRKAKVAGFLKVKNKHNPGNLEPAKYKGFTIMFDKVNKQVYPYVHDPAGNRVGEISGKFLSKYSAFEAIREWINKYMVERSKPPTPKAIRKYTLEECGKFAGISGEKLRKFVGLMARVHADEAQKLANGESSHMADVWIDHLKKDEEYTFASPEEAYEFYRVDRKQTKTNFFEQYKKFGYHSAVIATTYWNPFVRYAKQRNLEMGTSPAPVINKPNKPSNDDVVY